MQGFSRGFCLAMIGLLGGVAVDGQGREIGFGLTGSMVAGFWEGRLDSGLWQKGLRFRVFG